MVVISLEQKRDEIIILPSSLSEIITISDNINNTIMLDEVSSLLPNNITTSSNIDASCQLSSTIRSLQTNSDDDDDDDKVVLRIKDENTKNDIANNNNNCESNTIEQNNCMDDEQQQQKKFINDTDTVCITKSSEIFSLHQIFETDETIDGPSSPAPSIDSKSSDYCNDIPKFEIMRSYLESEFVPEEFWHLQRDSFIHRSYNEKLLSQKNEADSLINRSNSNTNDASNSVKRDSFIKNSFNTIRRSFSSRKKRNAMLAVPLADVGVGDDECGSGERDCSEQNSDNSNIDEKCDYVMIDDHLLLNPMTQNAMDLNRRNSSSSSCASHR